VKNRSQQDKQKNDSVDSYHTVLLSKICANLSDLSPVFNTLMHSANLQIMLTIAKQQIFVSNTQIVSRITMRKGLPEKTKTIDNFFS
jgi:hypothetical protein